MRNRKIAIGAAAAAFLAALVWVVPCFLPAIFVVERSIEIKQKPDVVFGYFADFEKWHTWSPWDAIDPKASHFYTGRPGTVGHRWTWQGSHFGGGTTTIVDVSPGVSLEAHSRYGHDLNLKSKFFINISPVGEGTRVVLKNEEVLVYPSGRWVGLLMYLWQGSDFTRGLSKLKRIAEANHAL